MGFISDLLGYVLNFIYNWVENYGLSIILFSVILQIIMLPFSIKQQKSMRKSAKIQGEVQKLQVKYRNNPELLNQEVMGLYKKEKISPFSGCLSSIIQIILFLSVFYLISSPLTHMKKVGSTEEGAKKLETYTQEIKESGEAVSYPEIKIIEDKAATDPDVYINMDFLGLNLSGIPMKNYKDIKVLIIPVLYVITTFINIKISMNMTKKKNDKKEKKKEENGEENSMEEQLESMQQMTNSMNYMMPIFSICIAVIAPLGLSLYWLVKNILQLIERFIIDKLIKKEEA